MKTRKLWNKSRLSLSEYLSPCDEIDEGLFLYLGEVVAPQYLSRDFVQKGEAEVNQHGVDYYMTAHAADNGRYYYLGILPEFKQ